MEVSKTAGSCCGHAGGVSLQRTYSSIYQNEWRFRKLAIDPTAPVHFQLMASPSYVKYRSPLAVLLSAPADQAHVMRLCPWKDMWVLAMDEHKCPLREMDRPVSGLPKPHVPPLLLFCPLLVQYLSSLHLVLTFLFLR